MKLPTPPLLPLLAALALAAPVAPALAADQGPYVVVAAGRTSYDYDCYFLYDCDHAGANGGKVVAGYRFNVFAVEVSATDWGKASIPFNNKLRLRSTGLNGAWAMHFSPTIQGLLRAGIAQIWLNRSDDGKTDHVEATLGLGLVVDLAPALALEFAWDAASAAGRNSGSVLAQSLSAGLRLKF